MLAGLTNRKPGSHAGSATVWPCDWGEVTEPLSVCFPVHKIGMMIRGRRMTVMISALRTSQDG